MQPTARTDQTDGGSGAGQQDAAARHDQQYAEGRVGVEVASAAALQHDERHDVARDAAGDQSRARAAVLRS